MDAFRRIEIESWERRDLFRFYQSFANPNYSVSVSLDVAPLYRYAKDNGQSFFLLTLFLFCRLLTFCKSIFFSFQG